MKKLILMIALMIVSCSTESDEFLTADARANLCQKQIVLSPTVTGTIEEELASMTVQCTSNKIDRLTWTVDPETRYHVVIQNEEGLWLLQTVTSGNNGFYIGSYVVSREPNFTSIYILKGRQYYLYFSKSGIKVPFIVEGK